MGLCGMRSVAIALVVLLSSGAVAQDAEREVVVTGKADASTIHAYDVAKALALREAVRQGVGVTIMSETKVEDFVTKYDVLVESCLGYVREVHIVRDIVRNGFREVTIRAVVGEDQPDPGAAAELLRERVGMPRIVVEVVANVDGVELQPNVVYLVRNRVNEILGPDTDLVILSTSAGAREWRDRFVGEDALANWRKHRVDYEVLIRIVLSGAYIKLDERSGMHKVAMQADMSANWVATGETIYVDTTGRRTVLSSHGEHEVAERCLKGGNGFDKSKSLDAFLHRVLRRWALDTDRGSRRTLDFYKISQPEYDRVLARLRENSAVRGAYEYALVPQGISSIGVKYTPGQAALHELVVQALPDWKVHDEQNRYTLFIRKPAPSSEDDASRETGEPVNDDPLEETEQASHPEGDARQPAALDQGVMGLRMAGQVLLTLGVLVVIVALAYLLYRNLSGVKES